MQMLYPMICVAENRASLVWEFLSLLRAGAHWSDNIRVWARCICIWKPSQWENSPAGHSCKFCDSIDNLHQMFSSSGGCGRPESGPGKETDINIDYQDGWVKQCTEDSRQELGKTWEAWSFYKAGGTKQNYSSELFINWFYLPVPSLFRVIQLKNY